MAHELILAGADPVAIARDVFYSAPVSKVLLLGAALSSLKREGRLAWLWVTHQDMVRTCAAEEDCEGIVNVAIGISGVEAAAFLRELPDRRVRVSLRSKGRVNVEAIAERLAAEATETPLAAPWMGPSQARSKKSSRTAPRRGNLLPQQNLAQPAAVGRLGEQSFLRDHA